MSDCYCLTKDELDQFIQNLVYQEQLDNSHLNAVVQNCSNWLARSVGLAYFLGRIIQKKINNGTLATNYIEQVYNLKEQIFFELNEFDGDFISYLLRHDRLNDSLASLDEVLEIYHSNYIDKQYGRIIRT